MLTNEITGYAVLKGGVFDMKVALLSQVIAMVTEADLIRGDEDELLTFIDFVQIYGEVC